MPSSQHVRRTVVAVVLTVLSLLVAFPAAASSDAAGFESCLLSEINADRAAAGAGALTLAIDLTEGVRDHSAWMAANVFEHMSTAARDAILPDSTTTWGENVAYASMVSDCSYIHEMLMDSPGHQANILNGSFRYVALGVHFDGTAAWVTELFFDATAYAPTGNGMFWDDDNSVLEADIEKLAAAGITSGCGNGMFCPNESVTRGQMAAFLVRALDLPAAGPFGFTDTANNTFAADIDSLAAAGITTGCGGGAYCPNDAVTRAQMAAFLARALDLPAAPSAGFTDTAGTPFAADIDSLAAAGITSGCGDGTFCPDDAVTRAQMAAFLVRALDL